MRFINPLSTIVHAAWQQDERRALRLRVLGRVLLLPLILSWLSGCASERLHRLRVFSRVLLWSLILSWLSGCASMVGSSKQEIALLSKPRGAQVYVFNTNGAEVYRGVTPTRVQLDKSDGSRFGRQDYFVVFRKSGHTPVARRLYTDPQTNTYIWGNLLIASAAAASSATAGLAAIFAGMVFIDPNGGEMYQISPKILTAELPEKDDANQTREGGSGLAQLNVEKAD